MAVRNVRLNYRLDKIFERWYELIAAKASRSSSRLTGSRGRPKTRASTDTGSTSTRTCDRTFTRAADSPGTCTSANAMFLDQCAHLWEQIDDLEGFGDDVVLMNVVLASRNSNDE